MAELLKPVAESEDNAILQIIVLAIVMIASAIGSVLKKRQEPTQGQKPRPPTGSTTGTTIPTTPRPQPPRARRPRPATERQMPAPAGARHEADSQDARIDRMEQLEQQRRQRTAAIERQMRERAEQLRRQTEASADQNRAKAATVEHIRHTARQRKQIAEQATAAGAATGSPLEEMQHRMFAEATSVRPVPMSDRLKALLVEPDWRAAIILAEIVGPPVGLRDPYQQTGTNPPALSA